MELSYDAGNTISYHSGTFQTITVKKVQAKVGKVDESPKDVKRSDELHYQIATGVPTCENQREL
jgi:hypothetical protein